MKILKSQDSQKIEWMILFGIFILSFLVNFFTPLLTDDFFYAYHSKSIPEIFNHQVWHYFNWGGRTIAHTIAEIFLYMPKGIFNIFNSLIQVLEVYLIYKIAKGNSKERKPVLLIATYFLLWFFLPVFGVTNIWLVGSCNYLWTTVMILFLIYQYIQEEKDTVGNILFMFLFGVLAGWSNENTSFGCLVTICGLCVWKKSHKKSISKWNIAGILGNVTGFALMILAPGNFVRSETLVEEKTFLVRIISRFMQYTENIVTYLLPLIIILTILISVYIYQKKKIDQRIIPFIFGSIFTIYSMLLSPQFPDRAWTGVVVLLIVPIIMLLYSVESVSKVIYYVMIDSIVIGSFIFVQGYFLLLADVRNLNLTWKAREKEILEIKENNGTKAEFERYYPITSKSPAYGLADIEKDPKHWANDLVAKYYGLEEVKEKDGENHK